MDMAVIGAIVRQVLTALGTLAVSKGLIDAGMLEQVIGALMVLASFIWSFVQKKQAQAQITKAEIAPSAAPTTKLAA